jgi:hypothetical protein
MTVSSWRRGGEACAIRRLVEIGLKVMTYIADTRRRRRLNTTKVPPRFVLSLGVW